jgi:hypothetical protein
MWISIKVTSFTAISTVEPVNSNPAKSEDILWNKNTLSGPKLLFSVQIAPWNKDTSELGTLLAGPKGVLISQVSL